MKWQAGIVLMAIFSGMFFPASLPLIIGHGEHAAIGTLDVCHSAVPALSTNGEMPCVTMHPSNLPFYFSSTTSKSLHPVFIEVVFTAPNEHPPKA